MAAKKYVFKKDAIYGELSADEIKEYEQSMGSLTGVFINGVGFIPCGDSDKLMLVEELARYKKEHWGKDKNARYCGNDA